MDANPLDGLTHEQYRDLMENLIDDGYRDLAVKLKAAFPPPRETGWYEVSRVQGYVCAMWWDEKTATWRWSLDPDVTPSGADNIDESKPIVKLVKAS